MRRRSRCKLGPYRIAARRGKRVAVVALARRLAGILYAMMRDGTEFDAGRFVTVGRSSRAPRCRPTKSRVENSRETTGCLSWFTSMGVASATECLAASDGRCRDGAAHPPNPPYAPATERRPCGARTEG